jgi:hypothetical protein
MGILLSLVGFFLYVAAGLMLVVKAFRVSTGWGFATLLIPFAALVFVFKNWDDTKNTFLAGIGGFALLILGTAMTPRPISDAQRQAAQATSTQVSQASAVPASSQPYEPPRSAYRLPVPPPPARTAATDTTSTEEEEPVRLKQVYIDRAARVYYAADCKTRPADAARVAKSVAEMQGFTAAACPPKKRR